MTTNTTTAWPFYTLPVSVVANRAEEIFEDTTDGDMTPSVWNALKSFGKEPSDELCQAVLAHLDERYAAEKAGADPAIEAARLAAVERHNQEREAAQKDREEALDLLQKLEKQSDSPKWGKKWAKADVRSAGLASWDHDWGTPPTDAFVIVVHGWEERCVKAGVYTRPENYEHCPKKLAALRAFVEA